MSVGSVFGMLRSEAPWRLRCAPLSQMWVVGLGFDNGNLWFRTGGGGGAHLGRVL